MPITVYFYFQASFNLLWLLSNSLKSSLQSTLYKFIVLGSLGLCPFHFWAWEAKRVLTITNQINYLKYFFFKVPMEMGKTKLIKIFFLKKNFKNKVTNWCHVMMFRVYTLFIYCLKIKKLTRLLCYELQCLFNIQCILLANFNYFFNVS